MATTRTSPGRRSVRRTAGAGARNSADTKSVDGLTFVGATGGASSDTLDGSTTEPREISEQNSATRDLMDYEGHTLANAIRINQRGQ